MRHPGLDSRLLAIGWSIAAGTAASEEVSPRGGGHIGGDWSALYVESDFCGPELAGCIDEAICFKHSSELCGKDGSLDPEACPQPLLSCKPCFPFSRCGADNATNTANLPEDIDCLPYQIQAQNQFGKIDVISCDFTEEDFPFPRPFGEGTDTGKYQCCQEGPALPPFVHDFAFQITVYPLLVIYCIAAVASTAIIVGLSIPLFLQLKDGNKNHQRKSSRKKGIQPCYSTYNLYTIYLALPDLIYGISRIALESSMIDQKFNPNYYSHAVHPSDTLANGHDLNGPAAWAYANANLWLNAIVSYQVMVLLESSKNVQRVDPPSLKRVSIQAGSVFFGSAIYLCIEYVLLQEAWKGEILGDFEKMDLVYNIYWYSNLLIYSMPIVYVVYVTFLVWWRGYIPSLSGITARGRAMRELFFYFTRIIVVFILLWIPCVVLVFYNYLTGHVWALTIAMYAPAVQAITSSCLALTKSDARKYVFDLVTLSYLFGNKNSLKLCSSKPTGLPVAEIEAAEVPETRHATSTGNSGTTTEERTMHLVATLNEVSAIAGSNANAASNYEDPDAGTNVSPNDHDDADNGRMSPGYPGS